MKVELYHSDRFMDKIWKLDEVKNLVDFLILNDKRYLTEWANVVMSNTTVMKYKKSTWKINYKMDNMENKKAEDFINLVDNLYNLAIKGNFKNEKEQQNYLDKLRGGVLEVLTYKIVFNNFKNDECIKNNNCKVLINGQAVRLGNKKTVDIAKWNRQIRYGEFYECKVWEKRFDKEVISFLNKLKEEIDKVSLSISIVAGVSLNMQAYLKNQFKKIGAVNLIPIGREELIKKLDNVS